MLKQFQPKNCSLHRDARRQKPGHRIATATVDSRQAALTCISFCFRYNTIQYKIKLALENYQASCQFYPAHKLKELKPTLTEMK